MLNDPAGWIYVQLKDEIPKFGSGLRKVRIVKSGPKWVTLLYPRSKGYEITRRLSRKLWEEISLKSTSYNPATGNK